MARYAVTIFISAFLLFQVQPLIARYVLPWFGGGPAIWTSCMLFFQSMLLGGYLYAHLLSVRLTVRTQTWVHVSLLLLSLALLPIAPSASLKPDGTAPPVQAILWLLLATVGGPYLLLASTGPLMQRWFSLSFPGRSPYRLYALSNVGSMLALLSYPFFFEPRLRLMQQVWIWTALYAVFAVLAVWCAWQLRRLPHGEVKDVEPDGGLDAETAERLGEEQLAAYQATRPQSPGVLRALMWLALSATGSALLLATTNQMCIDVAVVPFLWVLPLSLYLLTFVICFDNPRWYDRRVFGLLLGLAVAGACWQLEKGLDTSIPGLVSLYSFVLFVSCMTCHGELVAMRPAPRHLTWFYLMISLGGALGGLLVAVGTPAWFLGFWEFPVALFAACVVTLTAWCVNRVWQGRREMGFWIWVIGAAAQTAAVYRFAYLAFAEDFAEGQAAWLFIGSAAIQIVGLIAAADQERRSWAVGIIAAVVTLLQLGWAEYATPGIALQRWPLPVICVASALVGWATVAQFNRASDRMRRTLAAVLLEWAALAALAALWIWEIEPEAARVAGTGAYCLAVIVGGFGNWRGRSFFSQGGWYWSAAVLAYALGMMECLGFAKHTLADYPGDSPMLELWQDMMAWLPIQYPVGMPMRMGMLGAIGIARTLDKLPWIAEAGGELEPPDLRRGVWLWAPATAACAVGAVLLYQQIEKPDDALHLSRNFYGVLKVSEYTDDIGKHYSLTHGQIEHGLQYLDEQWKNEPTTYYGVGTGVEMALRLHPRRLQGGDGEQPGPLKVAVIGLGTGSMAANGMPGDEFRFYEINPDVVALSGEKGFFTYLDDSEAQTEVVLGDARVMLERELENQGSQQFDVIVVDAFSSDAIPVHLLTRECADLYQRSLKDDGILAIHISNRYLDLNPITRALAEHLDWQAVRIESEDDPTTGVYSSTWILLTANEEFLAMPEVRQGHWEWTEEDIAPILWTDDFASLYQIID